MRKLYSMNLDENLVLELDKMIEGKASRTDMIETLISNYVKAHGGFRSYNTDDLEFLKNGKEKSVKYIGFKLPLSLHSNFINLCKASGVKPGQMLKSMVYRYVCIYARTEQNVSCQKCSFIHNGITNCPRCGAGYPH
jgi:hypothetical protein